ncbi:hypothetical protein ZWY2020_016427 [Hordeum vulgare]|nr:hypothetical protein ZWY2020_016427 [Hordeum vulgare]
MASEEDDFLFGSYTDGEEDPVAAEAKEQRAKRRAEGEWGTDKVWAKHQGQQLELQLKYLGSRASSLRIAATTGSSSSVQYPFHVYGHVSLRDDLDAKRLPLFRRDRGRCQKIADAQGAFLSLTGPPRGIVLHSDLHIEIDLKMRSLDSESDIQIANCCLKDKVATSYSKLIRSRLVGPLCSVDLTYAPVHEAVEATFKFALSRVRTRIERPNGSSAREWQRFNKGNKEHREFLGKITVGVSGIADGVLLYDGSSLVGEGGLIRLQRRVVAAPM